MVIALTGLLPSASAFYAPAEQRWVNRDPIGELGFERIRRHTGTVQHADLNRYQFIANDPIGNLDAFGLKLYKCVRQAKTMGDNLHAYLWDGKSSCGRTGAAYATGEDAEGDKGPGTPGHTCVEIPGSDGKESAVMECCRRVSFSPFFPGVNDCHNWVDRCLSKNGLDDPPMNRFNGRFWERVAEGVDKGLQ